MKAETGLRVTEIWSFDPKTSIKIPLCIATVNAGFPSPAEGHIDRSLDLNEFLIKHPAATFLIKVTGTSMIQAGIHPGDILIVDKSLDPQDNNIVIAILNDEFTVKRFHRVNDKCYLMPENPAFKPIELGGDMTLQVWGVVTWVIHKV